MIFRNLIIATSIAMSNGTAILNKTPQPNRAVDTFLAQATETGIATTRTYDIPYLIDGFNEQYRLCRNDLYVTNTAVRIKGNVYKQVRRRYKTNVEQYIFGNLTTIEELIQDTNNQINNNTYGGCMEMIVLQINPYQYISNTDLNFITNLITGTQLTNYNYYYEIFNTTSDISFLLDNYTLEQNLFNYRYELGERARNGEIEFNYSVDQSNPIDEYSNNEIDFGRTISIPTTETSYLIINIIPYLNATNPAYENVNNANNYLFQTGTMQLAGTYMIPSENYDVVDIPGMMFEILTMPFTFISVAFNLTLFPGTDYYVNVSNLFLSILGVFIFIMLLKILIGLVKGS